MNTQLARLPCFGERAVEIVDQPSQLSRMRGCGGECRRRQEGFQFAEPASGNAARRATPQRRAVATAAAASRGPRAAVPARYTARPTAITIHDTSTTSRVKMPHDHTRSAFDRNFIAAASSRNPITTFTRASHGPERGNWLTSCGAGASTTNGSAKVAEYASSPAIGRCQSPCAATTSSVPRNAAVQVSEVRVNVSRHQQRARG